MIVRMPSPTRAARSRLSKVRPAFLEQLLLERRQARLQTLEAPDESLLLPEDRLGDLVLLGGRVLLRRSPAQDEGHEGQGD